MSRPVFVPVYEEPENIIRDRILARIPDTWRKEPGDFIYDAVAAVPLEIKQCQMEHDEVLKNGYAQYAEGDDLDLLLRENGLSRKAATPNKRTLDVTALAGVNIPAGRVVTSIVLDGYGDPILYTVDSTVNFGAGGTQEVHVTCKTPGTIGNLSNGSAFMFSPPIPGISAVADQGTDTLGEDTETDDDAFNRMDFAINNADTGGNKNDYVRWAQDVDGVGKARCTPRWNGNGTVKVAIVGTDYKPASGGVVTAVQDIIDPGSQGLGLGQAPIGAAVTVVAATQVTINIAATSLTLATGYVSNSVVEAFTDTVSAHFNSIALVDGQDGNPLKVVYNKILALLMNTPGVVNFTGLTVNGGTADVNIAANSVAVLGTVTM